MILRRVKILLIFFSIFFVNLSYAQVYRWVDEKGVVHFTDDFLQVPEKYRSKTQNMGVTQEKMEPKGQAGEPSSAKKKEEPYRDRMGRGEEYWKERMEPWRKKLAVSQEKMESLRLKYNDLTEKINVSKSSAERAAIRNERDRVKSEIDVCKQEIEEAKIMLDKKIPEEAQLYRAKPEWVKP